jgi:hypothetical protein
MLLSLVAMQSRSSPAATASVIPDADAFVWSANPTNNYGGAGAISVSGSAAVNGTNTQTGLFDSLLRFSMSNVVSSLDAVHGSHDWLVTRATLRLTELGAPPSPIFNRGVGAFEIRWIAADSWIEGTGIPLGPTADGVTWSEVLALLNPAKDVTLGQSTNNGADGPLACSLSLKEPFVSEVRSGSGVTLYLTAASPQIGFTAGSRTFFSTNYPELEIRAEANPHPWIDSIQAAGTSLSVSFGTVSNWTYTLQFMDGLAASAGGWSDLATVSARATNSHATLVDGITNRERYYRLALSPVGD